MRFCCLCKRKSTQDNKIILHKFPKDPSIRQKWIKACGLHDKDVSRLHICSNHFELSENLLALKRLPLEAIPTVEKAVPNHPIELSNMSTNMSTNITNVLKSSKGNVTSPTVLYIMDQNNVVQSILEVATPDHSLPIIESTCISKSSEVNVISPTVSDVMDCDNADIMEYDNADIMECDNAVQPISKISISDHSYCEAVFSPKKRLFAQPRYISEINISDVSSPKNARRLINFIKEEDRKKCSRIRCLSAHNKRLLKRVATLQELVSHLKEKVSEDVANNALINMRLSIDANDNCEQLSDKKQSKQAILKKKENSLIEDVSEPLVKWFEESPKQNFEKLDQLGDKKTQERFLLRKKEDLLTKDVSERLLVKQLQENPHLKIEDELAAHTDKMFNNWRDSGIAAKDDQTITVPHKIPKLKEDVVPSIFTADCCRSVVPKISYYYVTPFMKRNGKKKQTLNRLN
ncbi:uncharacterized protein LOC105204077 isoform X2 [Solenopsis invicta]|uniref:uncharacterized protein LOC105204077 isoform X2 n=1 Tax=Solenopsis invicta TaxID=13686 RepID=UPI00193D3954|nr:uncharacterized protein LOC105204077 isoform X2 [Solenopsis invicta]